MRPRTIAPQIVCKLAEKGAMTMKEICGELPAHDDSNVTKNVLLLCREGKLRTVREPNTLARHYGVPREDTLAPRMRKHYWLTRDGLFYAIECECKLDGWEDRLTEARGRAAAIDPPLADFLRYVIPRIRRLRTFGRTQPQAHVERWYVEFGLERR